jgi:uncharacterized protein (DUF433 family)
MSELHRVTTIPGLCGGRPTIRGMRIRVQDILDLLAAGADRAEILEDYPYLEDGDITASLEYASRSLQRSRDAYSRVTQQPPGDCWITGE